jgi:hypothetical protein
VIDYLKLLGANTVSHVAGCWLRLGCHCSNLLLTSCVSAAAADEEFDQLCFEYGIELDDVVSAFAGQPAACTAATTTTAVQPQHITWHSALLCCM